MNILESYEVNGKLYVTTKFLSTYFSKTEKQVGRWKSDGMPVAVKPKELKIRGDVFHLDECIKWVSENINPSKSRATARRGKEVDIDAMMNEANLEELDDLTFDEADRRKKIEDLKLAKLKREKEEGLLIEADDVDKALYEQAIMHRTKLDNDEKILPILLENKTQEEIAYIYHEHNNDHLEMLDSQLEPRIKKDPSNYDIFHKVLEARMKKATPKQIIEAIKSLW